MTEEKRNGLPKEAVEPKDKPTAGYGLKASPSTSPLQVSRRARPTMVYVDGFNLYHGMRARFGRKYHWLDLMALSRSLLKDDQSLAGVKYFTANVRDDSDAAGRQKVYLNALKFSGAEIIHGRFQEKTVECRGCGKPWRTYEEKESDVNFCVNLLDDARSHAFEVALLITGDSDMSPAVRLAKSQLPGARFVAAFPPERYSAELETACDAKFHIGQAKLRQAQFPESFVAGKTVLSRPYHWR